jgi:hypothetical protein
MTSRIMKASQYLGRGWFTYYFMRHKLRNYTKNTDSFCAQYEGSGGSGSTAPQIFNLGGAWIGGSAWLSFVHQLLYPEGKSSQYLLCRRLVGVPNCSGY